MLVPGDPILTGHSRPFNLSMRNEGLSYIGIITEEEESFPSISTLDFAFNTPFTL
jgi:hypothetical protein